MKHVFIVRDFYNETISLYYVNAADEESAKKYFTKKFAPYLDTDYSNFIKGISEYSEIEIEYFGLEEKITTL